MARALLIGCGCHARAAAGLLVEAGWAVRGSSRTAEGLAKIEAAGVEAAEADPDRVGTIVDLVGDVTVVGWLLGAADGPVEQARALHAERLPSLLEKLVDSPVRGFVYEAAGPAGEEILGIGRTAVADAERRWRLPVAFVTAERSDPEAWTRAVADATTSVVGL